MTEAPEVAKRRFILSLPDDLDQLLRAAAASRGEAVAVWIREAIREKLDRDTP